MSIKESLSSLGKIADRHSPEILLGIGLGGMVATVILAIKVTPKATESIKKKKKEKSKDKLTLKETVGAAWKYYIPVLLTGIASGACIIGSNTIQNKRNYALAAIATASETALKSYTEKVIETVGEKKERDIRNSSSQELLNNHEVVDKNIIITSKGNTLCFDPMTNSDFISDMDQIQKAVNEVNRRLLHEHFVSLNEFYYELNIPATRAGDIIGWVDDEFLDVKFDACLKDGRPVLVIRYKVSDKYNYERKFA